MQKEVYRTIKDYLICQNIKVVNTPKNNINYLNNNLTQEQIINQLNLIVSFHNTTKNSGKYILEKINNTTGKTVEKYKIQLNILKRNVKEMKHRTILNNFEKTIINNSPYFIEKAENCIDKIYLNKYTELIIRSMNNSEICLGNTYFNNLRLIGNEIQISNIKKLSYDMVELDAYYLFNKLKRKNSNINFDNMISKFCYLENLNDNSFKFISFLLEYPSEFIKYCNRYFYKKKRCDINKYHAKLLKAINIDKHYLMR